MKGLGRLVAVVTGAVLGKVVADQVREELFWRKATPEQLKARADAQMRAGNGNVSSEEEIDITDVDRRN